MEEHFMYSGELLASRFDERGGRITEVRGGL
jgi:hypothetical protein